MARDKIIDIGTEQIKLSERELLFSEAYLSDSDRNATQAALAVGYAKKTARVTAAKLLSKGNIQKYLDFKTQPLLDKYGASQDKIVQELASIGFSKITDFVDDTWKVKKPSELTPQQAAAISQIKVKTENSENGGIDTTVEFKVWDKLKSLQELLALSGLKGKEEDKGSTTNVQNNFYGSVNHHIKKQ